MYFFRTLYTSHASFTQFCWMAKPHHIYVIHYVLSSFYMYFVPIPVGICLRKVNKSTSIHVKSMLFNRSQVDMDATWRPVFATSGSLSMLQPIRALVVHKWLHFMVRYGIWLFLHNRTPTVFYLGHFLMVNWRLWSTGYHRLVLTRINFNTSMDE